MKIVLEARQRLIENITKSLTKPEKLFLLSIKQGEPEWSLLNIPNIEKLPAIGWKLNNIRNMDNQKHELAIQKLRDFLCI